LNELPPEEELREFLTRVRSAHNELFSIQDLLLVGFGSIGGGQREKYQV